MKQELIAIVLGIGICNFSQAQVEQKANAKNEYSEPINFEESNEYNRIIPADVLDMYSKVLAQSGNTASNVAEKFSSKRNRKIPETYSLNEADLIEAVNKNNINLLFFKPNKIFYTIPEDIQIWNIMDSQMSHLAGFKSLKSGFYNLNGRPIFFTDFIYRHKSRLRRSILCICMHNERIVEIVYNYPIGNTIEIALP